MSTLDPAPECAKAGTTLRKVAHLVSWTDTAHPGTPYWWEGATWSDLNDPLPDRADLVVIGAGYTGLSAAIAAHDAGARVVVVDAIQPGHGASTRNGGMFGAPPRLSWDELNRHFDAETANGVFGEAPETMAFVRALIDRENIDCDFQETGRLQLAWTQSHFKSQQTLAKALTEKTDVPAQIIPPAALRDHITTPHYSGGLYFPDHCALHPRKFHDGLLRAVMNRDIPVIADCPVTQTAQTGGRHQITTTKGSIDAGHVVMATNGYTTAQHRWFSRRVFPLPSYLIATEPLSPNLIRELAPGGRMMVETRARHSYFRISPDGTRILWGGRASMVHLDIETAAQRLFDTMCEVWPDLSDTRVSHAWSGNTGFSFLQMPHVGVHNGVHFAMGYSGSGTVMAPYLGAKAAYRALGDPRGDTAYANTRFQPRWFHAGGKPHFLHAADQWYRHYVDRQETRRAHRR